MRKRIVLLMLLLVGGIFIGLPQSLVEAAELNFTVKPILPENQIEKKVNYFDLRVEPGQKQTIELEMKNTGNEEIEVKMHIAPADTNVNGVIHYPDARQEGYQYDESMKNKITDFVKIAESVKLGPDEEKKIPIEIEVPTEAFDGIIAGGILFEQQEKEADKEESKGGGMGVRNKFMYRLGIKLSENETEVEPNLKLLNVHAGQLTYRNVVYAQLQNPEATVLEGLKIDAKVTNRGSDNVLYQEIKNGLRVAPNSNFEYPVSLGDKAFKAGQYTLLLNAEDADGRKWEFKQDFTITAEEAKKYNDDSAVQLEYGINWWLIGGIAGGVLVLLLCLIWIIVAVKKKKKAAQRSAIRAKRASKKEGAGSSNSKSKKSSSSKKRK